MESSEFPRSGKPNEENGDEIEENSQEKGPEIILRLIEDISGNPSPYGRS